MRLIRHTAVAGAVIFAVAAGMAWFSTPVPETRPAVDKSEVDALVLDGTFSAVTLTDPPQVWTTAKFDAMPAAEQNRAVELVRHHCGAESVEIIRTK